MRNLKEFYGPEELDLLSKSLDQACQLLALTTPAGSNRRRDVAGIILQLTELRQLESAQLEATAARLYRERHGS